MTNLEDFPTAVVHNVRVSLAAFSFLNICDFILINNALVSKSRHKEIIIPPTSFEGNIPHFLSSNILLLEGKQRISTWLLDITIYFLTHGFHDLHQRKILTK